MGFINGYIGEKLWRKGYKIVGKFPENIKPGIDFQVDYIFDVLITDVNNNKEYRRLKHNFMRRKIRMRFNNRKNTDINILWNFYRKVKGSYKAFLFILPFQEQDVTESGYKKLFCEVKPANELSWQNKYDLNKTWNEQDRGRIYDYLSGKMAFFIPYKNYSSFLVKYNNKEYYPLKDINWKNQFNVSVSWNNAMNVNTGLYSYLTTDGVMRSNYYILLSGFDEKDYFTFYRETYFDYSKWVYYKVNNPRPVIFAKFEDNNLSKTIFENMLSNMEINLVEV